MVGKRFGRLTVVKEVEPKILPSGRKIRALECVCDCGNRKIVTANHLSSGHTTSCGCYKSEADSEHAKTHGMSNTRLYHIWGAMRRRCKTRPGYAHVSVCSEWQRFEPFCEWAMSHGYSDNLSIDRIDNSGNYEPSNCRWATAIQQANNTSKNRRYEMYGVTFTIAEWARMFEVSHSVVRGRLDRGWDIERALTVPSRSELQRSAGTRI